MVGIDQQLDGDISDALYAADTPSASNPFLTALDFATGGTTGNYGAFYSTNNQAFVASTATPVTLNTTYIFRGVTIGAPTSRLVIGNYGVYNIQFSAQLYNTSGASQTVTFWLRKNGVDIPNSAKDVTIQGAVANYTADWSWLAEANATDYFEIIFFTPVISVTLIAVPAGGGKPAIPSMLVVVTQGSANVQTEIVESEYKFFGAAPQNIGPGGANPQTLVLNTIPYLVKSSVVPGRSRLVRYILTLSKTSSPSGSVTFEFTIGGTVLSVIMSSGAGTYSDNNVELKLFINFRAGNQIEVTGVAERYITGSANDTNTTRIVGTWNTAIPNNITARFIRTSGNPGFTVEVEQVTSQLI